MNASGMKQEDIERIEHALFFEPPEMRSSLIRFAMLITFASVIASGGLISDSVAAVVGAMIVAPLMTPIMGVVVALVIGSGSRALRCLVIVVAGVALAVFIGWLFATLMPFGWNPTTSAQIISRTSPRLLDLVIALASGGAGAYALSRTDVADALPGVAIAISLVPPLNTAGILLAGGETDLAKGAFLLFTTNFAAILLAGTVTFVLTGLAEGVGRSWWDLRAAGLAILLFVAIIAIPLRANSTALWNDVHHENSARAIVEAWLAPTDWELYEVRVNGTDLEMALGGHGDLPPTESVITSLREVMGPDMTLTARIVDLRKEVVYTQADRPQDVVTATPEA